LRVSICTIYSKKKESLEKNEDPQVKK